MANIEQVLDRNGVGHFYLLIKNKLTTYFRTLFVSKKDGYGLSQNDFTNELKDKLENMSESGGGNGTVISKDEIVNGYYNAENSLFYEDAEFSKVITGNSDKLYIDIDNNVIYRFNNSTFVPITSHINLTPLTNTEIDKIIASVDSSTE